MYLYSYNIVSQVIIFCPVWKRNRIPPPRGELTGTQCPGVYLGHPVPGGYKYGDLALQVGGVSRIGPIKYGLESRGTLT
jgi:hypothetical protein